MAGKKQISSDAGKSFKSVVDSTPVSNLERRTKLAEIINESRVNLLSILNLSSNENSDWTRIQNIIHAELERTSDPLVKAETERWIERLLDAEAELVEGNLRLVLMVVRRYTKGASGALEEMDFVQEGCEGLLDAVRRFDFSGGSGFLAYALIRIRKRVLLALEKQPRLVRIPAHLIRKSRYLREVIDDFASENGRYPMPHEIESRAGGEMDWSILLSLSEHVHSIHDPVGDSGLSLEEQLPADGSGPDIVKLSETISDALTRLDKRAKFILVMRYGLQDGEIHTLSSIAEVLGLSIERVRQIEKTSIRILSENINGLDLSDWLQ
jgi:RNA polymerase primary sigma factor